MRYVKAVENCDPNVQGPSGHGNQTSGSGRSVVPNISCTATGSGSGRLRATKSGSDESNTSLGKLICALASIL